jgi:hypothetical protein
MGQMFIVLKRNPQKPEPQKIHPKGRTREKARSKKGDDGKKTIFSVLSKQYNKQGRRPLNQEFLSLNQSLWQQGMESISESTKQCFSWPGTSEDFKLVTACETNWNSCT